MWFTTDKTHLSISLIYFSAGLSFFNIFVPCF